MQFNSKHEGYAFLQQEYEQALLHLERAKMDIGFYWLNLTKGHFNDPIKKGHALKELKYLATSSEALADSAARLSNLARALTAHIENEGKTDEFKVLGYTGAKCENCNRVRVERRDDGSEICEKCGWDQKNKEYTSRDY